MISLYALLLISGLHLSMIPAQSTTTIPPTTNKGTTTYTFPEFPYKESKKNEATFREVEAACEKGCLGKSGLSKVTCIRQCVSPSCYRDLYQQDLLEEGEVDVRLNSFKGCFIQRYNKSRP